MSASFLKSIILSFHRWAGIILAPVFLAIVISGGILALKPILQAPVLAGAPSSAEASAMLATLAAVDPGGRASRVGLSADGRAVTIGSNSINEPNGTFVLGSAEAVSGPESGFDFFGAVKKFHKELLIDADGFVLYATYAMGFILLAGPFLGRLRMRNTLLGWHLTVGWLALPLLLLLPLTGILMALHIDVGRPSAFEAATPPVSVTRGIEAVARLPDVQAIVSARRFRAGNMMVEAISGGGAKTYVVDGTGKAAVFGGPGLFKSLHEGLWAGIWSGLLNLAISVLLVVLTVTGFMSWFRRRRQSRRRSGSADAEILVAYASQTGTAARLAEASFQALRNAGAKAACMSLNSIRPEEISRYRHVLLIVSTTGEGELAEPGRAFLKELPEAGGIDASFAMLALGDSRYRYFCAGGEMLRAALVEKGAEEFLDMARADGAPQAAWRQWLGSVQKKLVREELALSFGEIEGPAADLPVALTLVERTRLDKGDAHDTGETWQVVFTKQGEAVFNPGDLLMLSPGAGETERCYSIGSSAIVDPDRIVLTVSRAVWTDDGGQGREGRMSTLLCRDLPLGSRVSGAVRRHPHFNLPEDPATPIIMVATGCGIAPFTGFIEERSRLGDASGPAWLMFGNRYREGDFLYGEAIAGWRRNGALSRLSTAFSRDCGDGGYITREITANGREIVSLLRDRGGVLYVCGRTRLGEGVEAALVQALVTNDNLSENDARATVRKWKMAGSLRQDLFD